jgi:hypothetical protein
MYCYTINLCFNIYYWVIKITDIIFASRYIYPIFVNMEIYYWIIEIVYIISTMGPLF